MPKVSFALLMLLGFLVVAACTKDEPKTNTTSAPAASSAPPIAASASVAPITSTTPGPVGRLPDGWPADVPVYPGATLGASELSSRGSSVTMKTNDGPEKVAAFYVTSLKGMTKGQDLGAGPLMTVSFRDEKRSVTVMAMTMADATQVTVTVLAK